MASNAPAPVVSATTVLAHEAAHFGAHARDWWNPKGSSAMLHKLGPARLGYIRGWIDRHFGSVSQTLRPLAGKRALDVGCGAGLITEPLARLGANVIGVEVAPESVIVAREHAAAMGLSIHYHEGGVETLEDLGFDLVTALEVIEHVSDPALFLRAIRDRLAPDGLFILSTPNRTLASRLALVGAAEQFGLIPGGTHDWSQFITPDEMTSLLASTGMAPLETRGIVFDPRTGFAIGDRLDLNYIMAVRAV